MLPVFATTGISRESFVTGTVMHRAEAPQKTVAPFLTGPPIIGLRCFNSATLDMLELFALFGSSESGIVAIASGTRFFFVIFQFNHVSNGARTTPC